MARGKIGFEGVQVRRQPSNLAEFYSEPETDGQRNQMHDSTSKQGVVQGWEEVVHQTLILEHGTPLGARVVDREAPVGIEWDDCQVRERSKDLIA